MHNMFKNKGLKTTKKPFVVEPKVTDPSVHIVATLAWACDEGKGLRPRQGLAKVQANNEA
jgi:hypothetical protein